MLLELRKVHILETDKLRPSFTCMAVVAKASHPHDVILILRGQDSNPAYRAEDALCCAYNCIV